MFFFVFLNPFLVSVISLLFSLPLNFSFHISCLLLNTSYFYTALFSQPQTLVSAKGEDIQTLTSLRFQLVYIPLCISTPTFSFKVIIFMFSYLLFSFHVLLTNLLISKYYNLSCFIARFNEAVAQEKSYLEM